jgi:3-isopropylmalate dehydrogenase
MHQEQQRSNTSGMAKRKLDIVVMGGDGIGPEVMDQAIRILTEVSLHLEGISLEFDFHDVGVGQYLKSGEALPASAFDAARRCDAVLLGAMGLPNVRYPDGKEIAPQLDLREQLGLYGGVRPIYLYHRNDTPLKGYEAGEIDFVILRESTEGLFAGRGATFDPEADEATNVMKITRQGAERVCRMAFEIARKRNKRKLVTLIDKANVLSAMVFMRQIFDEVAKQYPDCRSEYVYIDASTLYLVRTPERFDVMVTENMFGDILSDLGAGLVGGMGMAPSGDIGDEAAVFQPSHGSAPDIAGKGIANPIAMILSAAMMLEWFDLPETIRAAKLITQAISNVLEQPSARTADMGGKMSTTEMTDAISVELIKLARNVSGTKT